MSTNLGTIFRILLIQFAVKGMTLRLPIHCANYLDERKTFLDNRENIHTENDFEVSELLLLGVTLNNDASNTFILNATIQYILATKRFNS